MSQNEFKIIIWLSVSGRSNQCVLSTTLKFINDKGLNYLNKLFQTAHESNRTLRNDYRKLHFAFSQNNNYENPFRKKTAGQALLSFLETSKWSKLAVYKKVEYH